MKVAILGAVLLLAFASGCGKGNGNSSGNVLPEQCQINPASPGCTGVCFGNPYQPGCAGWGICGTDPYAEGCAGYCQANPFGSGCNEGSPTFGGTGTIGTIGTLGQNGLGTLAASTGQGTKDTDLQQAQMQSQSLQDRAQQISNQFGMSLNAAVRLTALADRMNELTASGSLTDEDRAAITDAALSVAGISADDETAAATVLIQTGDHTAVDNLLLKAASNLGMSSPVMLRDQILPSLGIQLPQ